MSYPKIELSSYHEVVTTFQKLRKKAVGSLGQSKWPDGPCSACGKPLGDYPDTEISEFSGIRLPRYASSSKDGMFIFHAACSGRMPPLDPTVPTTTFD